MQTLSDEIALEIFEYIDEPDIQNIEKIPELAYFFDWPFWRKKALYKFGIPGWYFDLPLSQNREISCKERYIEIVTKFEIVAQSLERYKDGEYRGICDEFRAVTLAIQRGNVKYLSQIPEVNKENLRKATSNSNLRKIGMAELDFVPKFFPIFYNHGHPIQMTAQTADKISQFIREGNLTQLETELLNKKWTVPGIIASIGEEKSFQLVVKHFGEFSLDRQFQTLMSCLFSGNSEHFIQLHKIYNRIINGNKFLKRAYYTANLQAINYLEENGANIKTFKKYRLLLEGNNFHPRPVEVYKILEKLLQGKKPDLIKIINYLNSDIDILVLFRSYGLTRPDKHLVTDFMCGRNITEYGVQQLMKYDAQSLILLEECLRDINISIYRNSFPFHYNSRKELIEEGIRKLRSVDSNGRKEDLEEMVKEALRECELIENDNKSKPDTCSLS
ncbi:hypothetical protein pv_250 [Pithovirus sibericum]|uniref:Uncharacterized protein n=1 Tax=Pithovirus sibericum TaxID=1450746 RepID=W5S663_9VIRU|nr:hypothetical protein pv_250 [Pithovirus sibericum]AHH01817.1 hypothetical protein pv_250 [Pithovirus sibericum]